MTDPSAAPPPAPGFSPVYSSHGHGRKTHIAIGEADALCGIQTRFAHLFWDRGDEHDIVEAREYVEVDADGYCCRRCRQLLLAHVDRLEAGARLP